MTVSVRLHESTERRLVAYCKAHRISKSEAVTNALILFLTDKAFQLTPYELGEAGFEKQKSSKAAKQQSTAKQQSSKAQGLV